MEQKRLTLPNKPELLKSLGAGEGNWRGEWPQGPNPWAAGEVLRYLFHGSHLLMCWPSYTGVRIASVCSDTG